jgi:hypothetical protein
MNMADHDLYRPLEERLADEARQVLNDSPRPAMAALQVELRRRRRRQSLAATACAAAALTAVVVVAISVFRRPAADDVRFPTIARDTRQPVAASTEGNAPRDDDPSSSRERAVAEDPPSVMAIAILIPTAGGSGDPEFIPGWYIPEQVEALDTADLSPAERSAVSRLLGLEPEFSDDETI